MSVSAATSSSQIQMDYMKLLVTQLQNQNPLEPMDNNQMASQLTAFSQLQQLESMNTNFASVLKNAEHSYAASLIGKDITYSITDKAGETMVKEGIVSQTYNNVDGKTMLIAGNDIVDMENIISVKN